MRRAATEWLRRHDPELAATKKAVRAAVVVPCVFALGYATGNAEVAAFALFGAFAVLVMVDLTAAPDRRRHGYLLLAAAGYLLIPIGTLASRQPAAGVPVMAVVAFAVLFGSIASPLLAQATPAALLLLVLPICLPATPADIGPRLLGFTIAVVVSVPAVLLVWPSPFRAGLRQGLAALADALADVGAAHAEGRRDPAASERARAGGQALLAEFERTAYLPTGAAPGDSVLCRLVTRLERAEEELAGLDQEPVGALDPTHVPTVDAATRVLRAAASVLRAGPGSDTGPLDQARAALVRARDRSTAEAVEHMVAGARSAPPEGRPGRAAADGAGVVLAEALDPTFRSRSLAHVVEAVGSDVLTASEEAAQGWGQRTAALVQGARSRLASHASLESIWFRNSLRGAIGLALAVLVVQLTGVQHGFWVALGTLSVLRSNALGTSTTAARVVIGAAIGVVIGSVLVWATGDATAALWALLPLMVLVAAFAPAAISFAAGQSAFTVTVLVAFAIIEPAGFDLGLVRAEDVTIGAAVALGVGLLLWPRGASAALGSALRQTLVTGAGYLAAAVERVMAPGYDVDVVQPDRQALDAVRRLEEAFRIYLTERGAKTVDATSLTALYVDASQVRSSGQLLASLPVRPLPPDCGRMPAIVEAGSALRQAYAAAAGWYEEVGAYLEGRAPGPPRLPEAQAARRRRILEAFDEAAGRADESPMRMVLRLLWADEALEELLSLQPRFREAAVSFATRAPWWGSLRRPVVPRSRSPESVPA